jgi:Mrp family chromosome partitioning ATPase
MERIKKPLQLAPDVAEIELPDFRRRLGDGSDIEYAETRVLEVRRAVLERSRLLGGGLHDEVGNAYKILRTQVLQRLAAKRWQTVAVLSPGAGEGKTLTAINLAIALASTRSHTSLLVDLDWRRPSVHRYFDFAPERDVVDYLRGEGSLAEVLVNPGVPRFCVLPCKQPLPEASELLGSLGPFVAELKGRYANRVVLFDLPPLLATDDALAFLPHVDGALLVVEENRTQREDVLRSIELIGQERLLGTVVNKSWHKPAKY